MDIKEDTELGMIINKSQNAHQDEHQGEYQAEHTRNYYNTSVVKVQLQGNNSASASVFFFSTQIFKCTHQMAPQNKHS